MNQRLIQLRWALVSGMAGAMIWGQWFLDIDLPWAGLLAALGLLMAFNLLAMRRERAGVADQAAMTRALVFDLTALGVMLYLTGGATNPLVSLLLLPVTIGALALPRAWVAGLAGLAIALYSVLMNVSLPLAVHDAERATQLHLGGMWVTFVVSSLLLAWLVGRMTEALRARDAQLAAAREQALRNAQVVMLGQQAAGAAHALGSPLATMTILAGELAQDQRLPDDVHADAALLLEQLAQCKRCIGQMVQQAGVTRAGDSAAMSAAMTVQTWLSGVLERWHSVWPRASCRLACTDPAKSLPVTLGIQVEQALTNLLDNAARMSPADVRVTAECQPENLCIAVCDGGPGFPAAVMENGGRAPQFASEQGSGMGLWLTRSIAESLGGRLLLENTANGGRAVLLLPLKKVCTE